MTDPMTNRYLDLNTYLRNRFGCRVQKITIDAGMSCPNRDGRISTGGCIYCNPSGSGTGAHLQGLSITDQLLAGKAAMGRRYGAKKFIAYFQSYTNTYAPVPTLKKMYDEALAVEDIVGLSIGTRPDCVDESVLSLLGGYAADHLVWIEYGLQSAHDATLSRINRGHDFQAFARAVDLTRNRGIAICAHVILGLPGETRQQMIETAKILAGMRIDGIKIHLLYVVKGTKLAEMYQNGEFACLTQDEYVDIVCEFLAHLPKDMVIQRLTGDPHRSELVSPDWALEKSATLSLIRQRLEKCDIRQGDRFCGE